MDETNQSYVNFRSLPANVPSLCIPRVYPNITESYIRKIIEKLKLGVIDRIDIVNKNNAKGQNFNRVFIHFKKWINSGNSIMARERLVNGKDIKIIYDDPWYWKVSAYKENTRVKQMPRQTIKLDIKEEEKEEEKE